MILPGQSQDEKEIERRQQEREQAAAYTRGLQRKQMRDLRKPKLSLEQIKEIMGR